MTEHQPHQHAAATAARLGGEGTPIQGRVLAVAGSDSGGGTGIQADIKTVTALGGYAMTVVTALAAQNTEGINGIVETPAGFIGKQMRLVLKDIGADVIKIGMVPNEETIEAVHYAYMEFAPDVPIVLDPVMMAKGGHALIDREAIHMVRQHFLLQCFVATPNIPEAEVLTGMEIHSLDDMKHAAEVMITLGQIYAQLRRHDEALENYDRALAVINSDAVNEMDSATVASWRESAADIPMSRAGILADAGRFEEAVEVFQELVAANPEDVGLKRNLAGILVQVGRNDEAFQVYDELMAQPNLTSADFYSIGVGFYQGSDYARAAQAFAGAAEKSVNDRDAIEMWARSLQIDSLWTDVPEPAERWMELDPNNQNAYLILAQAVNQTGDSQRASELVQAIEAMDVSVNDLQLSRYPDGGAVVNGSLINKNLDPGTMVRLRFTFYDSQGNPIGSQDKEVAVGDAGMAEVFQVDFQSAQRVEGYGYTIM